MAATIDKYRVDDRCRQHAGVDAIGDDLDNRGRSEQTGLDPSNRKGVGNRVDLIGDEAGVHRLDPVDASQVLGGDGGDGHRAVDAERSERRQVGGQTGPPSGSWAAMARTTGGVAANTALIVAHAKMGHVHPRTTLVASPSLNDPNFEFTVVFMLEHNDEGALGVVLTRPSELPVTDMFDGWADHAQHRRSSSVVQYRCRR